MYTYNTAKNLSKLFGFPFEEIEDLSDQILDQIPQNVTKSGWNKSGWRHTEETKKIMSEKKMGNKSNTGNILSETHRKNISKSMSGRPAWNKGKPNPKAAENARKGSEKMSQTVKGRKRKYRENGTWFWVYPTKK